MAVSAHESAYIRARRQPISAFTLGLAAPAAAEYPEKPIAIIVPFGPGDAIDGTARVMAEQLSDELGVPVIVKNIEGAGGGKARRRRRRRHPTATRCSWLRPAPAPRSP